MPLPHEVLECLISSQHLRLRDLLNLRATCKQLKHRLTRALPPYLNFDVVTDDPQMVRGHKKPSLCCSLLWTQCLGDCEIAFGSAQPFPPVTGLMAKVFPFRRSAAPPRSPSGAMPRRRLF